MEIIGEGRGALRHLSPVNSAILSKTCCTASVMASKELIPMYRESQHPGKGLEVMGSLFLGLAVAGERG